MGTITLQGSGLTAQGLAIHLDQLITATGWQGSSSDRRAARLAFASEAVERPIESFTELSAAELARVAHAASQGDLGAWLERHMQVGGEQRLLAAPTADAALDAPMSAREVKRAEWDSRPGAPMPSTLEAALMLIGRLKDHNRELLAERKRWKDLYETERQHLLAVSGSAGG